MLPKIFSIFVFFLTCFILSTFAADNIPAFPGASGGGCYSLGGRGGRVIEVTNLNNTGPGSLREACEAKGARTVVFRVSGTIDLKGKNILIINPYITIAGQTAPDGGVTIRGHEIRILTHDVIIRYLRIRVGRNDNFGFQEGDAIAIGDKAQNVIVDHCSMSWSNDENAQIWTTKYPAHHITFSWNIISEGLSYNHPSCGLIVGSNSNPDGIHDITLHNNLFINLYNRLPLIKSKNAKIINNIIYNWAYFATAISGGAKVDIISNLYKAGPLNTKNDHEIVIYPFNSRRPDSGVSGKPSLHIRGNIGPHQKLITNINQENMVKFVGNQNLQPLGYTDRDAPFVENNIEVHINAANDLEKIMLPHVGASMRIDESGQLRPNRDSIDKRLITEYKTREGKIPTTEMSVGGFQIFLYKSGNLAYNNADKDKDGLPDLYEKNNRLDPNNSSDGALDADGDGYSNLEEYLNGRIPN